MYFNALRLKMVGTVNVFLTRFIPFCYRYYFSKLAFCMPNASRKKRNPYATSSVSSSYTHWPALSGRRYAYFICAFVRNLVAKRLTGFPHQPLVRTNTGSPERPLHGFTLGNESPAYQVELTRHYPVNALLLIAEQNTECIIGSAFV